MKEKEIIVKEIITIQVADAVVLAKAITSEEEAEDAEEAKEDAAEEKKNSEHLKNVKCFNCGN
jgi:hypothetical protein